MSQLGSNCRCQKCPSIVLFSTGDERGDLSRVSLEAALCDRAPVRADTQPPHQSPHIFSCTFPLLLLFVIQLYSTMTQLCVIIFRNVENLNPMLYLIGRRRVRRPLSSSSGSSALRPRDCRSRRTATTPVTPHHSRHIPITTTFMIQVYGNMIQCV